MRRGGTFSIASSSSSSFSRHVGGCYCYAIRERARHAARRHVMSCGAVTATSTATATKVAVRRTRESSKRAPNPGAAHVAPCTTREQGSLVYEKCKSQNGREYNFQARRHVRVPLGVSYTARSASIHRPHRRNRHF